MVNIPGLYYQIPGVLYASVIQEPIDYVFTHNDTTLTIKIDGDIIIEGNARDAAKALFNHVLGILEEFMEDNDKFNNKFNLTFNKVRLCVKPISLIYPYQEGKAVPENFFLLKIEFDKLVKLIVFL